MAHLGDSIYFEVKLNGKVPFNRFITSKLLIQRRGEAGRSTRRHPLSIHRLKILTCRFAITQDLINQP
jgi:hypothetical protein